MTRAAGMVGFLLALILGMEGLTAGRTSAAIVALAGAVFVVAASLGTLRKNPQAQGLLCLLGLVFLARALPAYFRTYRAWPTLVVILFATLSLGLGLVGLVLDRYPGERSGSRRL